MEQRQAAPARRCPARWLWRWQAAAVGALPTSWFAQPAASRGACSCTGQLGRQRRGCGSLVAAAAACVCPPASLGRRLARTAVACDRFFFALPSPVLYLGGLQPQTLVHPSAKLAWGDGMGDSGR